MIEIENAPVGEPGGPEEALVKFLEGWRDMDWKKAVEYCQQSWVGIHEYPVEALKALLTVKPTKIHILGQGELNPVVYVAQIALNRQIARGVTDTKVIRAIVVCEAEPMVPLEGGHWGVNPTSIV